MLLAQLSELLDREKVRYNLSTLSPAYTPAEVANHFSTRGLGLLEPVFFEIDGQRLAMAVIPASLTVDFPLLSRLIAPRSTRPLTPAEIAERVSPCEPQAIPPIGRLFDAEVYWSPLVEKNQTIGFFVGSGRTLVTLERSEFQRLFDNPPQPLVPTRTKYRAYADPSRKIHESCILGISLENPDFTTAKLITITDWIKKHFTHCLVMLGDSLHRITVQIERGLPEKQALDHSLWLARDFVHSQFSVFHPGDSKCSFDFAFCSEIQQSSDYADYYQQLCGLFSEDPDFRESVRAFARIFVRRKPARMQHDGCHFELSCTYLLEELAVLCCLSRQRSYTFVYPGSLTILEEIAVGRHEGVPKYLHEMDYVNLHLKRR